MYSVRISIPVETCSTHRTSYASSCNPIASEPPPLTTEHKQVPPDFTQDKIRTYFGIQNELTACKTTDVNTSQVIVRLRVSTHNTLSNLHPQLQHFGNTDEHFTLAHQPITHSKLQDKHIHVAAELIMKLDSLAYHTDYMHL